jgi:hypothetical protein
MNSFACWRKGAFIDLHLIVKDIIGQIARQVATAADLSPREIIHDEGRVSYIDDLLWMDKFHCALGLSIL